MPSSGPPIQLNTSARRPGNNRIQVKATTHLVVYKYNPQECNKRKGLHGLSYTSCEQTSMLQPYHVIKHICCHTSCYQSHQILTLTSYSVSISHDTRKSRSWKHKPRLPHFPRKSGIDPPIQSQGPGPAAGRCNHLIDRYVETLVYRAKPRGSLGDTKRSTQCANDVPSTSNDTTMRSSSFSGHQSRGNSRTYFISTEK